MSKRTAQQIRESVTGMMIDALSKDTPAWRKPWLVSPNSGAPCNFSSGRRYTGINPLILMLSSMFSEYNSKHWGTGSAWMKLGAHIRKGEECTRVNFFRFIDKREKGKLVKDKDGKTVQIPLLREFPVFNVAQVQAPSIENLLKNDKARLIAIAAERDIKVSGNKEDIAEAIHKHIDQILDRYRVFEVTGNQEPDFEPAEVFVKATNANVSHKGTKAMYKTGTDSIIMPTKKSFVSMADYYETLFHELMHWGVTRVIPEIREGERKRTYAFEELVAEIGACVLTMEVGIPMSDQMIEKSQAYVKGWIKAMESDSKYIFDAASQASKVVDHLLNFIGKANTEFELSAA